jgi:hypothetical protein
MTPSLGSTHTFNTDAHDSGLTGRSFSAEGLELRTAGSHWKRMSTSLRKRECA